MKRILGAAAAALVAVTGFALAARFWWFFDLFSHFRVQYVVAAGLLGIAAMAIRAYGLTAVLLGVAVLHGFAIKDLWLGSPLEASPTGPNIRLASVNVLSANPTPEKVFEFVAGANADVVLVLDAKRRQWRAFLELFGDHYGYRVPRGWRDGDPLMVLSRWPITSYSLVLPPKGRAHLKVQIQIGDRRLTIVGVHAQSPSRADDFLRNRQLRQIAETVNAIDGPVIVAGDFNTSPWSPYFRDLLDVTGLRNAAEGRGWIATWPTWFWPAQVPIDHVLLKGPVAATAVRRGPRVGSDHFPIIADIRLLPESLADAGHANRSHLLPSRN